MSELRDFLVEIGTEELPPKALKRLSQAFNDEIVKALVAADIPFIASEVFASPRRMAVKINQLASRQPDKEVERRGPAVQAAFKEDGCPTPAAEGFAKSCGVTVDQLETMQTDKGAWLVYRVMTPGKSVTDLLPPIVENALNKLPIPKRMRWGTHSHAFVRPVHWVVMLYGKDVIECQILGIAAGRETRGHRFHHPQAVTVPEPSAYAMLLMTEAHVIADFDKRRDAIRGQINEAALKLAGNAVIDEALLDEVTGLVEWPQAVTGDFEARFLEVPPEVLVSAMKGHQKYFHLLDKQGKLMPHFITLANIESRNVASVKAGNERVIRPRLTDAEFFWKQDKKISLAERTAKLKDVVFQTKLGTVHEKIERVAMLSDYMAQQLKHKPDIAKRAAMLCKSDLISAMVGEFPELQGIMGRYYALNDGEPADVAQAIYEHYMPRFGGDVLPANTYGAILSIADKLDTMVGIFGIGQAPTGDKDPFALRRAALGILRVVIEKRLSLDLEQLVLHSAKSFPSGVLGKDTGTAVFDFMLERLRGYYLEQGMGHDEFDAVLAVRPTQPLDFEQRIKAVNAFRKLPEASSLAAANKRISNILKKAEHAIPGNVDPALLSQAEERTLYEQVKTLDAEVTANFKAGDYTAALNRLAALKTPVDAFFDSVMVMAEDAKQRDNRLALLNQLGGLFLGVADISRLQIS